MYNIPTWPCVHRAGSAFPIGLVEILLLLLLYSRRTPVAVAPRWRYLTFGKPARKKRYDLTLRHRRTKSFVDENISRPVVVVEPVDRRRPQSAFTLHRASTFLLFCGVGEHCTGTHVVHDRCPCDNVANNNHDRHRPVRSLVRPPVTGEYRGDDARGSFTAAGR